MSKITYTYSWTKYGDCDAATQNDKFFNSMKAFHTMIMLGGLIGCMVWVSNVSWEFSSWSESNSLIAPYVCSVLMSFIVALYESGKDRHSLDCCKLYFTYMRKKYPPELYEKLPLIDPEFLRFEKEAANALYLKKRHFIFFLLACLALFSVVYLFMAKNNGYYHFIYLIVMLVSVLSAVIYTVLNATNIL